MPSTKISHRSLALIASFFVTFALFESIADHARVDAGPMLLVQAAPAMVAQAVPAAPPVR